jgi:peptide chain release factor subunit 1
METSSVEKIRYKRLLQTIRSHRGDGTSMITLLIPNKKELHQVNTTLNEEYGTAANIKSRVNRLSVLSAITTAQQQLKLYNKVPDNGLVVLTGTVIEDENSKARKDVKMSFEPLKPVTSFLYLCDSSFHIDQLEQSLEDNKVYGIVVMDGNGFLIATLSGSNKKILYKESVDLPKKHGRGGQSALRFSRLAESARHNYLRKVSETMTNFFLDNNQLNNEGIVMAGSADLKMHIQNKEFFNPQLKIIKQVDVAYGGEAGLNEAINLCGDLFNELDLVKEKKALQEYFDLIAKDSPLICFGKNQVCSLLEQGSLEKVILHCDIVDLDVLCEIAQRVGTEMILVSDKTSEGTQFVRGFGGYGGITRYAINGYDGQDDDNEDEIWLDE